ncbi:MAG TPA: hypothetical protein VMK13_12005 [Streptosporangiaceae bacterium]|nr:hypothetical protein [Streptosporangiaceae bacterium]
MSMWRIRLTLSDDKRSRALFHEAVGDQLVSIVRLAPPGIDTAEITGEVVVELAHDEGLGAMLGALHNISPRVFVSRADPPAPPAAGPELAVGRPAPRAEQTSSWRASAGRRFSRSTLGR